MAHFVSDDTLKLVAGKIFDEAARYADRRFFAPDPGCKRI
jgi:hypothetical protein